MPREELGRSRIWPTLDSTTKPLFKKRDIVRAFVGDSTMTRVFDFVFGICLYAFRYKPLVLLIMPLSSSAVVAARIT